MDSFFFAAPPSTQLFIRFFFCRPTLQLFARQKTWGGKEGLAHLHRREMNPVSGRCTRPPWRQVNGRRCLGSVVRGIQRGHTMADDPSTRWRQRGNQMLAAREPNGGGAGTSGQAARPKLDISLGSVARGRLVHRNIRPSSNARKQTVTVGGRLTIPI
jgi:hypothetical protein